LTRQRRRISCLPALVGLLLTADEVEEILLDFHRGVRVPR